MNYVFCCCRCRRCQCRSPLVHFVSVIRRFKRHCRRLFCLVFFVVVVEHCQLAVANFIFTKVLMKINSGENSFHDSYKQIPTTNGEREREKKMPKFYSDNFSLDRNGIEISVCMILCVEGCVRCDISIWQNNFSFFSHFICFCFYAFCVCARSARSLCDIFNRDI